MKKNYFAPVSKVISMNCGNIMDDAVAPTSGVSKRVSDAPLF